jgi:hypothetical protein
MAELGFQAQIYNDLEEMPNRITFPDKTNQGRLLAMLMLWKRVEALASKKYDALLAQLIQEDMLKDPKQLKTPGVVVIGQSKVLTVEVNVSKPRREFNMEWFCAQMKKQFKVPESVTKELYEKAKQEGSTQNRTITVKELGVNI